MNNGTRLFTACSMEPNSGEPYGYMSNVVFSAMKANAYYSGVVSKIDLVLDGWGYFPGYMSTTQWPATYNDSIEVAPYTMQGGPESARERKGRANHLGSTRFNQFHAGRASNLLVRLRHGIICLHRERGTRPLPSSDDVLHCITQWHVDAIIHRLLRERDVPRPDYL